MADKILKNLKFDISLNKAYFKKIRKRIQK